MKKIILAIFVSLPLLSISQSLQLSNAHIDVENTLMAGKITITNTSAFPVEVLVKKEVVQVVEGHDVYFCWGTCYSPATTVSPEGRVIEAGESDETGFFGDVESNGFCGVTKVKYTFFVKGSPSNSAEYTYTYDFACGGTGIGVNQASAEVLSSVFPNPVQNAGKLSYNLGGRTYNEANIIVRNLTGAIVKNIKLSDEKGEATLHVNELNNGIYMYSLVVDGKAILTKKMTVVGN